MPRLLLLFTGFLILSLFPCLAPSYTSAEEPVEIAAAGQQATELQKQSDYHNRVEKKREEREIEKQEAAMGAVEGESRGLDNFVLVLLVISALTLFMVSRRISGNRRRRRPRRL
jgi:hypothetical protein